MYGNYIESLKRQKDRIDELISTYQQPQPVNNFINTNVTPNNNLIEWRILNENEEVDNLYVKNKTLFINDNLMVLKGVDGKLEKWEIKKVWPIDKKDTKINELEEEIKKLKEMISNEHTEHIKPVRECEQPTTNANEYANRQPKTNGKSISKQE